jgi:hypothetical protein
VSILKSLFGKKESSCCNVKIEEVNEEAKGKPKDDPKSGCCK